MRKSMAITLVAAAAAIAPLRTDAERRGSGDFSPMWAGQNVTGCREIGAADLTRELVADVILESGSS